MFVGADAPNWNDGALPTGVAPNPPENTHTYISVITSTINVFVSCLSTRLKMGDVSIDLLRKIQPKPMLIQ